MSLSSMQSTTHNITCMAGLPQHLCVYVHGRFAFARVTGENSAEHATNGLGAKQTSSRGNAKSGPWSGARVPCGHMIRHGELTVPLKSIQQRISTGEQQ